MSIDVSPPKRRYQELADHISGSILADGLSAGDRLPSERDFASKYQVSRQTIRESLIALEVVGVVEIRLGSGIYVKDPKTAGTQIDYEDAPGPLEIMEARKIFESEAVALAAERISNEELQKLGVLMQLMKASSDERKTEEAEDQDRKFHLVIAEASRNSAIQGTINWLWQLRSKSEISRFFHHKARLSGSEPNIEDHQAILTALTRHDADAARSAMHNHINRVYKEFSEFTLE